MGRLWNGCVTVADLLWNGCGMVVLVELCGMVVDMVVDMLWNVGGQCCVNSCGHGCVMVVDMVLERLCTWL